VHLSVQSRKHVVLARHDAVGSSLCVPMCRCQQHPGAERAAKNWQYERYSYVILRRGPRPPPPTDVLIEPHFRDFPEDVEQFSVDTPPRAPGPARRALEALRLEPIVGGVRQNVLTPEGIADAQRELQILTEERSMGKKRSTIDVDVHYAAARSADDGGDESDVEDGIIAADAAADLQAYLQAVADGTVVTAHDGAVESIRDSTERLKGVRVDAPGEQQSVSDAAQLDDTAHVSATASVSRTEPATETRCGASVSADQPYMHLGRPGDADAARLADADLHAQTNRQV
jgi:hypothetical protein